MWLHYFNQICNILMKTVTCLHYFNQICVMSALFQSISIMPVLFPPNDLLLKLQKIGFIIYANCLLKRQLHEMSKPISWGNKKNIIYLSSAEFAISKVMNMSEQSSSLTGWCIMISIVLMTAYNHPVSILRKSISGRHRPVRVADGPMTARCRFT